MTKHDNSSQNLLTQRLEDFGGSGDELWLAHANGYPPGSYRAFIEELTPHFSVTGYKHRPMWDEFNADERLSWMLFADDMIETLQQKGGDAPWVVGHSMGATIAMLAAAKHPELFRGLVLLDPVFKRSRHVLALRFMSEAQKRRMPMVRKTLKRPSLFANRQAAYAFHRERRAFGRFSDEILWDYINAGTKETGDGRVELAFSPQWEAAVYTSVPWVWPSIRRIEVPMMVLRGQESPVFTRSMYNRVLLLQPDAVLGQAPGGHLLPMEHPDTTAERVLAFLRLEGASVRDSEQSMSA